MVRKYNFKAEGTFDISVDEDIKIRDKKHVERYLKDTFMAYLTKQSGVKVTKVSCVKRKN